MTRRLSTERGQVMRAWLTHSNSTRARVSRFDTTCNKSQQNHSLTMGEHIWMLLITQMPTGGGSPLLWLERLMHKPKRRPLATSVRHRDHPAF